MSNGGKTKIREYAFGKNFKLIPVPIGTFPDDEDEVLPPPAGHNEIKALAIEVVEMFRKEEVDTFDRTFDIGEKLHAMYEACKDPACGYDGKNPHMRFGAALKAEILSRHHGGGTPIGATALRYCKQLHDVYGKHRDALRGRASVRTLRDFLPAKFDGERDIVIDALINGDTDTIEDILRGAKRKPKPKAKVEEKPALPAGVPQPGELSAMIRALFSAAEVDHREAATELFDALDEAAKKAIAEAAFEWHAA